MKNSLHHTNNINFTILTVVLMLLIPQITMNAQSFSTKGQFWASGLTGDDAPEGQSSFETQLGYIPTLSLYRDLNSNSFIDLEWSYRLDRIYSGDSLFGNVEKNYRLWLRYSSQRVEARLGLQKIAFGPATLLRSLAWFDTIDPRDPTGQTDAVEAFRLRVFPTNSLAIWTWIINNRKDTLSYGGRAELSNNMGDWGLTYHQDPTVSAQFVGQSPVLIAGPHQRVAVDYRYDGYFGFWFEGAGIFSDNKQDEELNRFTLMTLGADYTVPVGQGLLLMIETMRINGWSSVNSNDSDQAYTAFIASLPINILHQLMFITQVDWENNHAYNYIRWSVTYDYISLNFIFSINPRRGDYGFKEEYLPETVAGFGNGLQFMLIYNH